MTFFFNSTHLNSPSLNLINNFLEARGLRVHEKIGEGFQGKIYTLQDRKTGEIAHILKTIDRHLEFNPEQGAHLLANVQHPSSLFQKFLR